MVLKYPDATRSPWIQMPATDEIRRALFSDKCIEVYFGGGIIGDSLEIEQFVRQSECMIRASVSNLDRYAAYLRDDGFTLDVLLRDLRGQTPRTPAMERGHAFAKAMEQSR